MYSANAKIKCIQLISTVYMPLLHCHALHSDAMVTADHSHSSAVAYVTAIALTVIRIKSNEASFTRCIVGLYRIGLCS